MCNDISITLNSWAWWGENTRFTEYGSSNTYLSVREICSCVYIYICFVHYAYIIIYFIYIIYHLRFYIASGSRDAARIHRISSQSTKISEPDAKVPRGGVVYSTS